MPPFTKEEIAARWLFSGEYALSGLSVDEFWGSLSMARRRFVANAVAEIVAAPFACARVLLWGDEDIAREASHV